MILVERNEHEKRAVEMIVSSFMKTATMEEIFQELEKALNKLKLDELAKLLHEDRLHANWTKMSTTSLF